MIRFATHLWYNKCIVFCESRDKACTFTEIGAIWMYKIQNDQQISFEDFNQPLGLKMNPDNRWIKKSELMPWAKLEDQYDQLFESHLGSDGISFQTLRRTRGTRLG